MLKNIDDNERKIIVEKKKKLFKKILDFISLMAPTTDNFLSIRNNSFKFPENYTISILRIIPGTKESEEIYRSKTHYSKNVLVFTIEEDFKISVNILNNHPTGKEFNLDDIILQESLPFHFRLCNTGNLSGNKKKYFNMLSRKVQINKDVPVEKKYLMIHTKNILEIFYDKVDLNLPDLNISYYVNIIKSHIMGGNFTNLINILNNVKKKYKLKSSINDKQVEEETKGENEGENEGETKGEKKHLNKLNTIFKKIIENINKIISGGSSKINYINKINITYEQFILLFNTNNIRDDLKTEFIIKYFINKFQKINDSQLKDIVLNILDNINNTKDEPTFKSSIYFYNFSKISKAYTYEYTNLNKVEPLYYKSIDNINYKIGLPINNVKIEFLIGTIFWCLYIIQIKLYENIGIIFLLEQYFFDLATNNKILDLKTFLFKTIGVNIKTITKKELINNKSQYSDSYKYYNFHTNLLSSFKIPDQGEIYHNNRPSIPDCGEITTLTLLTLFCYDTKNNSFNIDLFPDSTDEYYKKFYLENNDFDSIYKKERNSPREHIEKTFWYKEQIRYFKKSEDDDDYNIEIIPHINNIFNLIILHIFKISSINITDNIETKVSALFKILNAKRSSNGLPDLDYKLDIVDENKAHIDFSDLSLKFTFVPTHGTFTFKTIKKINLVNNELNGIPINGIPNDIKKKNEYNGLYLYFTYINKCNLSFQKLFKEKFNYEDQKIFFIIKTLRIYEEIFIIDYDNFPTIFKPSVYNTKNKKKITYLSDQKKKLLIKEVLSSVGYNYFSTFLRLVTIHFRLIDIFNDKNKMKKFKTLLIFLKNECFFNITILISIYQTTRYNNIISSFGLVIFASTLDPIIIKPKRINNSEKNTNKLISIYFEDYKKYTNFIKGYSYIKIHDKLYTIENIYQNLNSVDIEINYKDDQIINNIELGCFNLFNILRYNNSFGYAHIYTNYKTQVTLNLKKKLIQDLNQYNYINDITKIISQSISDLNEIKLINIYQIFYIIEIWSNTFYGTLIYNYFKEFITEYRFYFVEWLNRRLLSDKILDNFPNIITLAFDFGFFLFPDAIIGINDLEIYKKNITCYKRVPYQDKIDFTNFRKYHIRNSFIFFLSNFPDKFIEKGYNSYNISGFFENIMLGYISRNINYKIEELKNVGNNNNYIRKYIRGYLILLIYITKHIYENMGNDVFNNHFYIMIRDGIKCLINVKRIIIQDLNNQYKLLLKKLVNNIKTLIKKDTDFFKEMKKQLYNDNLAVFLLLFTDHTLFDFIEQYLGNKQELRKSIIKNQDFIKSNESIKVFDKFNLNSESKKEGKSKYLVDNMYKNKYIKYKKKYLILKDILHINLV